MSGRRLSRGRRSPGNRCGLCPLFVVSFGGRDPGRSGQAVRVPRNAGLQCIGAAQAQVRQRADGLVQDDAGVVENLLKFSRSSSAFMPRQVRLATQVNGVERGRHRRSPKLVGRGECQGFDGLSSVFSTPCRCRGCWLRGSWAGIRTARSCPLGIAYRDRLARRTAGRMSALSRPGFAPRTASPVVCPEHDGEHDATRCAFFVAGPSVSGFSLSSGCKTIVFFVFPRQSRRRVPRLRRQDARAPKYRLR